MNSGSTNLRLIFWGTRRSKICLNVLVQLWCDSLTPALSNLQLSNSVSSNSQTASEVTPVESLHLVGAPQQVAPVFSQLLQRPPAIVQLLQAETNRNWTLVLTCWISFLKRKVLHECWHAALNWYSNRSKSIQKFSTCFFYALARTDCDEQKHAENESKKNYILFIWRSDYHHVECKKLFISKKTTQKHQTKEQSGITGQPGHL